MAVNEERYREAEERLWASLGADPDERRLHLERNDVTVRVQELGAGPPVLFVHGANVSGSSWASLAARLDGFRRILLDRPGTGASEPLREPLDAERLPRYAETLIVDVLDALELDTAHLVATSLGGYVGLRTAAAHPDRVDRMVQFSWPVGAPIERVPGSMRMMALPGLGRLMAAIPPSERAVRSIFRSIGHAESLEAGRITQRDVDWYLALLRHTDTMRNEVAAGRALLSVRGLDPRVALSHELLGSIRTPTRFLWGTNDPFGGEATARGLVERIPEAELEFVEGGGHAPWLDALDRCAEATGSFLSP